MLRFTHKSGSAETIATRVPAICGSSVYIPSPWYIPVTYICLVETAKMVTPTNVTGENHHLCGDSIMYHDGGYYNEDWNLTNKPTTHPPHLVEAKSALLI